MFAGLGVLLLVAGAIVTFAIDRQAEGVDIAALGWILMAGGALALLIALIQGMGWMSANRSHRANGMRTERHVSSDGQHVIEETHTN